MKGKVTKNNDVMTKNNDVMAKNNDVVYDTLIMFPMIVHVCVNVAL